MFFSCVYFFSLLEGKQHLKFASVITLYFQSYLLFNIPNFIIFLDPLCFFSIPLSKMFLSVMILSNGSVFGYKAQKCSRRPLSGTAKGQNKKRIWEIFCNHQLLTRHMANDKAICWSLDGDLQDNKDCRRGGWIQSHRFLLFKF